MITLTKKTRDLLTPDDALELLMQGNQRFVQNLKINRNLLNQINETCDGQYPFAFILSCIDSRTSAELIFDQGLGDIFSCRIAGNILNKDILGSMEFACKIAGAKVVLVLGHTNCGAIKGAVNDVKMENLTTLLAKIKPAIKSASLSNKNNNENFLTEVAKENATLVKEKIIKESNIIKDMIDSNQIILVSAIYDVSTGEVRILSKI